MLPLSLPKDYSLTPVMGNLVLTYSSLVVSRVPDAGRAKEALVEVAELHRKARIFREEGYRSSLGSTRQRDCLRLAKELEVEMRRMTVKAGGVYQWS